MRLIAFSKKALSKLIKKSRPRAAGCGDAKQNRRRGATSNTIALDVASQPAVIQKQQAAKQALQGKHNNSKQQNKRYKANSTATATCSLSPPQAHTQALCRPKCHVKRRWRATHKGTSEGACTAAAGCKADPTSTTPLSAPPLAPGRCPA